MAHKSKNLAYINWGVCYVADAAFFYLIFRTFSLKRPILEEFSFFRGVWYPSDQIDLISLKLGDQIDPVTPLKLVDQNNIVTLK